MRQMRIVIVEAVRRGFVDVRTDLQQPMHGRRVLVRRINLEMVEFQIHFHLQQPRSEVSEESDGISWMQRRRGAHGRDEQNCNQQTETGSAKLMTHHPHGGRLIRLALGSQLISAMVFGRVGRDGIAAATPQLHDLDSEVAVGEIRPCGNGLKS